MAGDVRKKMVLLTGPRQVGKTYLAKALMQEFQHPQYLNYDAHEDARIIQQQSWIPQVDLLVFDEIHTLPDWKRFLKGVYDTRQAQQAILVTGSARLDTFRQTGTSLAGRYYHFRLHPLSVRELSDQLSAEQALAMLNRLGGFPEPFLSGSEQEATRWRNQYYTDLIREDILEFGRVHELRAMRLLLDMLRQRVGAPLSYASLARDLQLSPHTVKRYVEMLEALHIVFLVRPWHRNIARAVLKEAKLYFYDTGLVQGDDGLKLENTIATHLLKHVHFLQDVRGESLGLHYLRDKEGHEVDFGLVRDDQLSHLIEVKLSDATPVANLKYFAARHPSTQAVQLVQHLRQEQQAGPLQILSASRWLAELAA
ncbi:MAG: ATP-binding protein [Verrucomicrobia bacterium]|nr:MAG: ATP-binding protein [Verrucomicrobiota bacterium]